jgi:hypothetical protein
MICLLRIHTLGSMLPYALSPLKSKLELTNARTKGLDDDHRTPLQQPRCSGHKLTQLKGTF